MTQSSCKRDTKSKSHPGMKLAPVRVFSCKHPLSSGWFFILLVFHENVFLICLRLRTDNIDVA